MPLSVFRAELILCESLGVTQHPARWSPDFPPLWPEMASAAVTRSDRPSSANLAWAISGVKREASSGQRHQFVTTNNEEGADISAPLEKVILCSGYSTNSILPQLLQFTVCLPLLTRWRNWVGNDIRQPWHKSRSTFATARPPLDLRSVS